MNIEENPYSSPLEPGNTPKYCIDLKAISLGGSIGMGVGFLWAILFGPSIDGPPSQNMSLIVFMTGFTATGTLVGLIKKYALFFGTFFGFLSMCIWAIVLLWNDPWVIIALIILGGSGLFCGSIIGAVFSYSVRSEIRKE
jgi:hypothetical protein